MNEATAILTKWREEAQDWTETPISIRGTSLNHNATASRLRTTTELLESRPKVLPGYSYDELGRWYSDWNQKVEQRLLIEAAKGETRE